MQDYAKQLLSAINQYDADNPESVNHLRDLVCWISDNDALKKDKVLAQLLYIASQKMRVFGYNIKELSMYCSAHPQLLKG